MDKQTEILSQIIWCAAHDDPGMSWERAEELAKESIDDVQRESNARNDSPSKTGKE